MASESMVDRSLTRATASGLFFYIGLLVLGVGIVVGVQWLSPFLSASIEVPVARSSVNSIKTQSDSVHVLLHVLATLSAVILTGALFGKICTYIGQPPVIGEVIAGLALGPSLLGAVSPEAMHTLVPTTQADPTGLVSTSLKVIAQLGVILYMFLVGLELNVAYLKRKAMSAIAISHASIVIPFALGALLSLWLYPQVADPSVPFLSFSLFIGIALSITAFPVLARILTDRNLHATPVGTIALSCAAADDVTAWCLLSLVVGIAKTEIGAAGIVVVGSLVFIFAMFFVVRPLLNRFLNYIDRSHPNLPKYAIALMYVLILAAGSLTEWIGIHAIFGAFLLGVIIPSDCGVAKNFLTKLKEPVTVLLLPAFFAYTGMRTEIGLLTDGSQWFLCAAIVLVAIAGKFGGTLLAARYSGETWRDSSILGVLMNTRGLMELIVLNIGLDLGIISPTLFAMMVVMAIVTTMMTSPALLLLSRIHSPT